MKIAPFLLLTFLYPLFICSQISIDSLIIERKIIVIDSVINDNHYEKALSLIEEFNSQKLDANYKQWGKVQLLKGSIYYEQYKLELAETILASTIKDWGNKKDTLNIEFINTQKKLADVYARMGKFDNSIYTYDKALEKSKKISGENSLQYAEILNNIGNLYLNHSQPKEAKPFYEIVLKIREYHLGKNHSSYADCLNNFGILYMDLGEYNKAELNYLKSLEIRENTIGDNHPKYVTSLNNLAIFYLQISQYEKAELFFLKAIKKDKEIYGEKHPHYATDINNLGIVYSNIGRHEEAEQLFLKSKEIREKVLGKDHPDYLASLNNLANLYSEKGKNEKAISLFKEVVKSKERTIGRENLDYTYSLTGLAIAYLEVKKYTLAESLFKEAILINEEILGENHIELLTDINYLAKIYIKTKQYKKAIPLKIRYYTINKSLITKGFDFFSEIEKENYYENRIKPLYSEMLSYASDFNFPKYNTLQYEIALFSKGLRLKASQLTNEYILKQQDSLALKNYKELININESLFNEQESYSKKEMSLKVMQKEKLEKELARASSSFRKEQNLNKINYNTLKKKVNSNEIAIEFIHFISSASKPVVKIIYAAIILMPNETSARFIKLFEEKKLTRLLGAGLKSKEELYVSRGIVPKKQNLSKQVYNLVWQPIDSLLQAENIQTVYYSPSGLLHRLNLSALPIDSTQVLGDKYKMVQLSSTRLLALDREEVNEENTAYIVGGVDYNYRNITHSFINNFHEAIYAWLEKQPDSLLQSSELAYSESTNDNYFSYVDRSLRGDSWTYLPGTREETQSISTLLNQKKYEVNYLSGNAATEADFKQLGTSTKSPKIIHLATHGFFFPDPVDSLKNNTQEPIFKISEHPMLRSGLLFAGANRVWSGESSPPDQEDGILTAYEISNMNLTNTELVVLSACETGLGDIQGSEGVYGLQRAFKKAGVRYLIMSLWQVPDRETSLFMQTFYQNYLEKGMSINDAFDATQKAMRAQFDDPYLWAGFVLME